MTEMLLDSLVVRVRADTQAFAADVRVLKDQLQGPMADAAQSVGTRLEGVFDRFVRTGKVGLEDLRKLALQVVGDIVAAQARAVFSSIPTGGGGGLGGIFGTIFGAPGRAIGGPVSAGRPYMVGEQGPELFVPSTGGRIEPAKAVGGRAVHITINVAAPSEARPEFMRRSAEQTAQAVRRALASER